MRGRVKARGSNLRRIVGESRRLYPTWAWAAAGFEKRPVKNVHPTQCANTVMGYSHQKCFLNQAVKMVICCAHAASLKGISKDVTF